MVGRQELPYEIRKTACELYAGRTGFSQEEIKSLFTEEVRNTVKLPLSHEGGFWNNMGNTFIRMELSEKLTPKPFPTRAKAFEYWLSLLPLWRQKELLLELCQKQNFPMSNGKPSSERRQQLAAMLTHFSIDAHVSPSLLKLDSTSVMTTWEKAMNRCESDPQGAITSARTLLESVCKHILETYGRHYDEKDTLQKLYALLVQELKIAPNLQSEHAFKQLFGGCSSIIEGIGVLRNKVGDAHGKGRDGTEITPSHAAFAVNLAGATAMFLVQTWEANQRPV